jgi:hypothetical protein
VAAVELSGRDITDLRPLHAPVVVAARSLTRELQASPMRGPAAGQQTPTFYRTAI